MTRPESEPVGPIARDAPGSDTDGEPYDIEVNEDSVNMKRFAAVANERNRNGYRMAHVFMQEGNTIVVWEKTP